MDGLAGALAVVLGLLAAFLLLVIVAAMTPDPLGCFDEDEDRRDEREEHNAEDDI